ncbi:MAG: FAD-dependent oxidoreductase [Desulfobacterales bacterium]
MAVSKAESYYRVSLKRETPAFIHEELCWPEFSTGSPCVGACPLQMDIPNYVMAIADGNPTKALSIIRESNPLPSVCGRVCHHPCEEVCNRKVVDNAVAIEWLKRYAVDCGEEDAPSPVPVTKEDKVAIIGAGPAGLTAAADLVQKGYRADIFEASSEPGGMLTSCIPDFILPKEAVHRDVEYLKGLGVRIHTGVRIGSTMSIESLREQGFKAVLVTVGAQKGVPLNVPGADLQGVSIGLPLLMDAKQGRMSPLSGKLWIIGGGGVALDVARTAVRNGVKEVHLACLESRADMPAFDWEIGDTEKEGIHIHPSLSPQEFTSKNGAKVNGITFKRVSSTWTDSDGVYHWSLMEGQGGDYSVEADSVVVAVGQMTDPGKLVENLLDTNEKGAIVVNQLTGQSSVAGIFAAGDIANTGRTVTDAMAAGRRAALSIDQFLSGEPIVPKDDNVESIMIKEEQVPVYMPRKERWAMPKLLPGQAVRTSAEVDLGYVGWQAAEEAARCLNCRMCAHCIFDRGQLCQDTGQRLLK